MSYNVSLPSYSVGTDVYKLVGSICAGYGHKAVAIGGHKAMAAVKDKLCSHAAALHGLGNTVEENELFHVFALFAFKSRHCIFLLP